MALSWVIKNCKFFENKNIRQYRRLGGVKMEVILVKGKSGFLLKNSEF